jgi:DNA-binding response OmpR family regulator
MKILLVEDDDASIALLTRNLSLQHHIIDAVKDGEMGWNYATTFEYDLIILDIMLPKLDGISLCKQLRGEGYTMPILLLTAQDLTIAKIQGFEAGADDYVVKPFEIAELLARVNALLRRSSANPLPLLSWGNLVLNPSTCEVSYNGQALTLTTKEYDLLELLLRDSYRVFSSEEIIDRLWSSDAFPAEATVRSHLRRLRHKLQAAGAPEDFIGTLHGRGYYLKPLPVEIEVRTEPTLTSQKPPQVALSTDRHQQQYQAFLAQTWIAIKPQCLEHLTELRAIGDRLRSGTCNDLEQQRARQLAHKLVGTLGVLSLLSAMSIARNIEAALDRETILPAFEAERLGIWIEELAAAIDRDPVTDNARMISEESPLLLLVDLDSHLDTALTQLAAERAWRTISFPTIAAATSYLEHPLDRNLPIVVAIGLVADREDRPHLESIREIVRHPNRSAIVLSDSDGLNERLAVARHGGKFLCTTNLSTAQIFAATTTPIEAAGEAKVMAVDDDLVWLRALPKLLQPWGLKVSTLADPQQFWTVLRLVQPQVLILDVNMPEIDGLALCQVLRSDPYWQQLPILFLSASNDPSIQQQAFRVGADDYLCKPVLGDELARRIRHRLARVQSERNSTERLK